MNEIRIGPPAQAAIGGAMLAVVLAVVLAQLPEIQRYLKVRKM